jgi:hypothetical protein
VAPCLQLLQALEQLTAQDAHLTDLLGEWITPALTDALRQSGMTTLADLQACIKRGGRWWSVMPGMGPGRARRLDAFVRMLLPPDKSSQSTEPSGWQTKAARARLEKYGACARDSVVDDAVRSWVLARASHEATRALLARCRPVHAVVPYKARKIDAGCNGRGLSCLHGVRRQSSGCVDQSNQGRAARTRLGALQQSADVH